MAETLPTVIMSEIRAPFKKITAHRSNVLGEMLETQSKSLSKLCQNLLPLSVVAVVLQLYWLYKQ